MNDQDTFEQLKYRIVRNHNGTFYYNKDGLFHREDGPAIIWTNGSKEWFFCGQLHREDGPAIEQANGSRQWYLHDRLVTKEEVMGKKDIS